MAPLAQSPDPHLRQTPQHLRAIARTLLVPITVTMLMTAGPLVPCLGAAEEDAPNVAAPESGSAVGSRSAVSTWRFTKDGSKEIVVTPEQKARQAARKAKRKERHAAETAAAAAKAASDASKPGTVAPAEKTKEASKDVPPPSGKIGGKAGGNVNGTGGAK